MAIDKCAGNVEVEKMLMSKNSKLETTTSTLSSSHPSIKSRIKSIFTSSKSTPTFEPFDHNINKSRISSVFSTKSEKLSNDNMGLMSEEIGKIGRQQKMMKMMEQEKTNSHLMQQSESGHDLYIQTQPTNSQMFKVRKRIGYFSYDE